MPILDQWPSDFATQQLYVSELQRRVNALLLGTQVRTCLSQTEPTDAALRAAVQAQTGTQPVMNSRVQWYDPVNALIQNTYALAPLPNPYSIGEFKPISKKPTRSDFVLLGTRELLPSETTVTALSVENADAANYSSLLVVFTAKVTAAVAYTEGVGLRFNDSAASVYESNRANYTPGGMTNTFWNTATAQHIPIFTPGNTGIRNGVAQGHFWIHNSNFAASDIVRAYFTVTGWSNLVWLADPVAADKITTFLAGGWGGNSPVRAITKVSLINAWADYFMQPSRLAVFGVR